MNRARCPAASRIAAVGAALSLAAAAGAPATVLAADRPTVPGAPAAVLPAKAPPSKAADETAVDDELIEFLGSVGDTGEEGDWLDFLTHTDIDKVAKRGSKAPRGR